MLEWIFSNWVASNNLDRISPYANDDFIGGFRDTYLGRQVVSRPGGMRAGIGSAGGLGALRASSGVWGWAPAEIEFGAFLALKADISWQQFR